jgi:Crp-like helix-turn-helix domain
MSVRTSALRDQIACRKSCAGQCGGGRGTGIEPSISQNDLSQIVGLSREMINKQLQVWANNRWILLERRRITVLQPDALARIIAPESRSE